MNNSFTQAALMVQASLLTATYELMRANKRTLSGNRKVPMQK